MNPAAAESDADQATRSWFAAIRLLAREVPAMYEKPRSGGVVTFVTGIPLPVMNGVFTETAHPDIAELAAAAEGMEGSGVPWCIQLRGEPDADVERLAGVHGLIQKQTTPLMLHRGEMEQKAPQPAVQGVRVIGPEEGEEYAAALAAGFQVPPQVMALFGSLEVLAVSHAVPYVAESAGQVVAVGLGVSLGESVGVFNIATLPGYRGRGYGRAITERIVADGIAQGASLAYLQSSQAGYRLYESMGFRTVESWTYLLAAE